MADSQRERYRLETKISSKGGFGDVWLATDTLLDRPVAVKCPKATDDPIRRERVLVEARMLARLNHPNITQIYDAFIDEDEDNLYLVIEFVDGKDLSNIIGRGTPLSLDIILEITIGILRALSYAHQRGLVHRDIKPANVMIGDDVKLTDFGLANLRSILGRGTGFVAGTPAYMAPEQVEGRATDGRADLYALGVILFEMITGGRLPFEYTDETEMLDAHLHTNPPPLSHFAPTVPPQLVELVSRLLAKDREDRYPSAEAVMDVLDAVQVGPTLGNLPVQLTPFVGREEELAKIQERLGDPACRLLTLVGPGGSGKTRLALEAAATQIDNYPHGVTFVSLAPLESVDSIAPTVAEALGFRFYEEGEPQQQLLDYLRQKRMLLILDNFEHLVEGAGLVTDILQIAPDVKILATSRARLNLGGEHLLAVAGMHFPDREKDEDLDRYSAVELFLQSARRVRPSLEPTADDMLYVARICRLVKGMPLAILLAATWIEILTPSEIAAEMRQSLDFLEADLSDLPARQQSIRAVFDHSWNLLSEQERKMFQRLSVFRGGFTRDAAQKVTGASLPDLMVLLNKSLIYRAARGRYEVHELLRQYAAERLDQSPAAGEAARAQHSVYYLGALRDWESDLKSARQQVALAELEADFENAQAAWNWALDSGRVGRLEQAIYSLFAFYGWRMRLREGEAACRKAASRLASVEKTVPPSVSDVRRILAQILSFQSWYNRLQGRTEACAQLLQRSLTLLERAESDGQDIRAAKAYILLEMGDVASESSRKQARRLYQQGLGFFRVLGDRWGISKALHSLGWLAWNSGAFSEAKELYEASLTVRRELGDRKGIAESLYGLSRVANRQGPFDEAERLVRESLAICDEIGDRIGIANGLRNLGGILLQRGKHVEAQALLEESAAIYKDLGMRHHFILSNYALGIANMVQGHYEQARFQGKMYLTLAQEIGYQRGIASCCYVLGAVELAAGGYAEAHRMFQESITVSRDIGQRDELSWSLAGLGYAARGLGNIPQARQYLSEALRTAIEIRAFMPFMLALPTIALLLADQGDEERAVELYTLASRYQFVDNSRWMQDLAGRHIAAVAATLPPDVVAAAQERGRARDLETTVTELLAELES